jgi:hypothetical protein
MAKKTALSKLHKPVHPVLAFVVIGLFVIAVISALVLRSSQNPTSTSQQYQTQLFPTATPEPVDTSAWKTYTDWKYHYSITLPPEFASYIPGKGYTGDTIDPQGNGFVQFEDTTLSGDYPNRTAKYGFYVRLEPGTPGGSNCTTDQECLNLIKKNVGPATGMPLQARILNRDVEGLAIVHTSPNSSSPTGEDLSVYYEYPFIANGMVFHAEVSFYYPKSFQQTQSKSPVINAILASISFANQ